MTRLDVRRLENLHPALLAAMRGCEQTAGVSVLDHGCMVADRYRDLIGHLRDGAPLAMGWRLPDWTRDPRAVQGLPDDDVMADYHLMHDCGKPHVLEVDADGRRHFPGHAAASERVWLASGGSPEIGALIGMDMDAHLLKDEGVPGFAKRPQARALLLTALSEVHANAGMFGGLESTSFKIKWKYLDKRGKAVLRQLG